MPVISTLYSDQKLLSMFAVVRVGTICGSLLSAWQYAAHSSDVGSAMPWVAGETVEAVAGKAIGECGV